MKVIYKWSVAVLVGAVLGAVAVQGLRAQAHRRCMSSQNSM